MAPDRRIERVRAVARGNRFAVLAAARDAQVGEILLHNHPSGRLEPSEADLALAARVYEEGLGTAIVDNEARALYVVVEPPAPRVRAALDPEEVEAFLAPGGALSDRFPGYEDRPEQRTMLREVVTRYNEGGIAVIEAGTGTGKSLAYLLPAAVWALRNGERTVVSTNTINLQEQLVRKDLPLVRELLGGELRWALVKGRGNYISIRRLHLAARTGPSLFEEDRSRELQALVDWAGATTDGSLSDLSLAVSEEVWEEVRSDADICMGARCPHFQACFHQRARRAAASAELLVANHALLLADVSVRRTTENWGQSAVLPAYRHVILDEGHNVEDAATSHLGAEVTRTGLFRALDRLDRNGKGILAAVEEGLHALPDRVGEAEALRTRLARRVRPEAARCREALNEFFDVLEPFVPDPEEEPLRLGRGDPRDPGERPEVLERLDGLIGACGRLRREIEGVRLVLEEDEALRDAFDARVLDLQALERRLASSERALGLVLAPGEGGASFVRWIEGRGRPGVGLRNVVLAAAPVEPGEILRAALFDQVETAVVTSATLSTGSGDFGFVRGRLGLASPGAAASGLASAWAGEFAFGEAATEVGPPPAAPERAVTELRLPSPFDHARQSLFCVPTDLAGIEAGAAFQDATARAIADLAQITGGGLFALFTSHRALRTVATHLRQAGVESRWPLFVHGEAPRFRLLADFVASGRGILLGTASFWEGVDVPGDPLRGLVLQKLPFRVPTEPVTQARMEAIEARGGNAFRAYLLPLAALRLKQGFGRLVRSREDRGAVVLLDARILTRSYGRTLLASLPGAPLRKGPWAELRKGLEAFYGDRGTDGCLDGPAG